MLLELHRFYKFVDHNESHDFLVGYQCKNINKTGSLIWLYKKILTAVPVAYSPLVSMPNNHEKSSNLDSIQLSHQNMVAPSTLC